MRNCISLMRIRIQQLLKSLDPDTDSKAKNNALLPKIYKIFLDYHKFFYITMSNCWFVSGRYQNLGVKFEQTDPDPANKFNAETDPQSGGEAIIQHMKNWKSRNKAAIL